MQSTTPIVPENRIKKALREGRVAVGTVLQDLNTRGMSLILDYAGLDFVIVDMEHNPFSLEAVADLIGWFRSTSVSVLVRPPSVLYHDLSRIMDAGAMGVFVANVETPEEAKAIVDGVMYPPLGMRQVGVYALHTEYRKPKPDEFMPARNAETTIIALIESVKGVENIEAICAMEGIDAIHPSHNDLSISLGLHGQYDHPRYKEAVRKITDAAKRHGKALSVIPQNDDDIARAYKDGFRILGLGSVHVTLLEAMKAKADHLRERVAAVSKS